MVVRSFGRDLRTVESRFGRILRTSQICSSGRSPLRRETISRPRARCSASIRVSKSTGSSWGEAVLNSSISVSGLSRSRITIRRRSFIGVEGFGGWRTFRAWRKGSVDLGRRFRCCRRLVRGRNHTRPGRQVNVDEALGECSAVGWLSCSAPRGVRKIDPSNDIRQCNISLFL